VSMLPKVAEHMARHGLNLHKLHIVPNGISPEEWPDLPRPLAGPLADYLKALKSAGKTIVGYAGAHGLPNAMDVLLDTAVLLRNASFSFVLVGSGQRKEWLAQRVQSEGLDNVALFDPIPKTQIPALLAQFDIAYIGWQRTSLYRFGIAPNKLMDYMMAGCTVLHSVEAGNDPVAEAGCGLSVAPESPQAVAQGLRQLAAATPQQRHDMGQRGRAFVLTHHTYPVLAQRFLEAMA